MANEIGFKSYCWVIGTTSYRTDNFNMSIEKQLQLLKKFRELKKHEGKVWNSNNAFQAEYYENNTHHQLKGRSRKDNHRHKHGSYLV